MTETATQNNTHKSTSAPAKRSFGSRGGSARGGDGKQGARGRGPRRRSNSRMRDAKPEFEQKIVGIRRVTRVVAGGRRFGFSVAIILGDKKGRVGVGVGKATDTALAIEKAARKARQNMITVKLTKSGSIPHEVQAKYCSSDVLIIPVSGKGLVAGSSVRNVLDLAGITDVSAKILSRSKNKINNARAAIVALQQL